MSFVPNFDYDVFISYATADDVTGPHTETGWITDLARDLEIALRQRLGGTGQLKLYLDKKELGANNTLDEILAAVDSSACFLSICSRSYVHRDWTKRELDRFCKSTAETNRVFALEILPLGPDETYPAVLAERHRLPFFRRSPVSQVAVPIARGDNEYGLLVHDLAEQIRVQLMAMRTVSGFRQAAAIVEIEAKGRKKVLLGQVTEDLDGQRDELRRYLEQFDHEVLPRQPYRQDGRGFRENVAADLAEADLFVQLQGPLKGRQPPDLPDGYIRCQLGLARDAGIEVVQWRSPTLVLSAIDDTEHKELLEDETVIVSGFEAFKSTVEDRLKPNDEHSSGHFGDQSLQTVFINADEPDLEYARHVRDEFVRSGFLAATPTVDPKPELLKEHLLDCDALVLLYGNASHVWADRSLRLFNKLRASRERPPKIVAVLLGPPPEKLSELSINMPGLKFYGDPTKWAENSVQEVIDALQT